MTAAKIVTIHDMSMFLMPSLHLYGKVQYFQFFIRAAAHRADRLIFVSNSTCDDFTKLFPDSKARGAVVHLGKSESLRPDIDPVLMANILRKHGVARPYILYIGTIEPRKNLSRLVKAFSSLAQLHPDHILVISGMKGWMYDDLFELVRTLGIERRVLFTGFLPELDKPYLIRGADLFAYPSLYEGFGVPVLEALACGAPTLTSNVSSLPEVAGDAALLVDPSSESEIASGLHLLLTDPELRAMLSRRAVARAAEFTWSRTASQTLRVYREAHRR